MGNWYHLIDGAIVPDGRYGSLQPVEERKIGYDKLGDDGAEPHVSTVFLGLDHGWDDGPPVLFETMVFWGGHALGGEQERYRTLIEAKAGHARWVETVRFVRSAMFAGLEP